MFIEVNADDHTGAQNAHDNLNKVVRFLQHGSRVGQWFTINENTEDLTGVFGFEACVKPGHLADEYENPYGVERYQDSFKINI